MTPEVDRLLELRAVARRPSLRRSLSLVVLLTTAVALILTTAAFVADTFLRNRRGVERGAYALLHVAESTCGNALLFADAEAGEEALRPLLLQPQVLGAALYLPDGRPLAKLARPGVFLPAAPPTSGRPELVQGHLVASKAVSLRGDGVGWAVLVVDATFLGSQLRTAALAAFGIATLTFLLSAAFARRLASRILVPLEALAVSARQVAGGGSFRHRIPAPRTEAELGTLIADYNAMLEALERQEDELNLTRDHLEALVMDRTADLEEANAALERQTLTDPLTGLHNRRYVDMVVPETVAQVARVHADHIAKAAPLPPYPDLVFLMVDLDHFKTVNDRYGHAAGDEVLRQFTHRLHQAVRESDTVVRWGGEEFLILARGIRREQGPMVAQRILAAVRSRPFDVGAPFPRTCSVGFAPFPLDPDHPSATPWERVVALADRCLYAAKTTGRNGFVGLERGPVDPAAQEAFLDHGPDGPGWELRQSFDDTLYWARGPRP